MQQTADVAVLGAGMVGVSAALHLQARGRDVVLVDRHGAAGLETSFGNAGLIERASIFPYLFPRDFGDLLRYALNLSPQAHYHFSALPSVAPWLWRYFRESSPERAKRHALDALPLVERCLEEHDALIQLSGAGDIVRRTGWIKLYRSEKSLAKGLVDAARLRDFSLRVEELDAAGLSALEPDIAPVVGAVHFRDTASVADPCAVAQAYAALFQRRGGRFLAGDVRALEQTRDGHWSAPTHDGALIVRDIVVALGPWSDQIFRPLGYDLPFAVKRGYHMHYGTKEGARLFHPVLDADNGYVLAPMTRGVRLTTGAEFARRDAPPTPVQVDKDELLARTLFPLGERLDPKPWMGCRPCFPDMLPIIGKAPRHQGLWFDFGHQHHGFTLGPVSGRLLAEMMTGETPFTDPAPYAVERFR
ncbi:amino acid dehydrogenase [Methylosinus sp. R-45379]|uniref:FAD-binding oxidoreductase n=1 Tax=Methylosinus sp. R-45379 TaxID=980563 RepID=UPI0007C8F2D0|nr:FAD-dependent oxidoreductase [Methylosinus sp. R-45379]OAI23603.1 amino acid dehydrogenase [Methylosinus sp. R-45379]